MRFKSLLGILIAVGSVALGEINLKVGDPESQIVATLGNPSITATKNGSTYYMYDGGDVIAKDGKVIAFPKNLATASQRKLAEREAYRIEKLKQEEFAATQKANGLVLYEKQWVTPEQKADLEKEAAATAAKKKEAKEEAFVQAGLRINDILISPPKFIGQKITVSGRFGHSRAEERSFSMSQGDRRIDVSYGNVSKATGEEILNQKVLSGAPVEVSGKLVVFRDSLWVIADQVYFPKF
jgi:outer membrane protein assembly factor BamE (lipoprotein component of BamABCDE complex)